MPSQSNDLLSYIRGVLIAWRNDPRSDDELLARFAQDSDGEAFKVLVWRYGRLVWRSCTRVLGEGSDAEDVFQAAFLALARKAGRFPIKNLAGWLHQVARQAALNAKTRARRRQRLEQQLQTVTQPELEDRLSRTELYAALDEELGDLPERLRIPLVLRYLDGKTLEDVAHIVGCSRRALGKRLARGEALLRERLERRGLAVGIGSVAVLLGSSTIASAVPTRLIGSTARAAVAFRSDALTGGAVEAARSVLGSLPASLGMTIMRKSLWIVLACCLGLAGAGLVACRTLSAWPDEPASVGPTGPPAAERPEQGREKQAHTDRDGNPLPPGALARLGTLRLRHAGSFGMGGADSVVFSRDSKVLITAGQANPIRLLDAATGKLLRSFGGCHQHEKVIIALSPDGRTLADRTEDGRISLWEVATGKLLRQLGADIIALAFSRDGRTLLSVSKDDKHLRVWEVATGKQVRDQPLQNANIPDDPQTYIFSPDGKTLALIHDMAKTNVAYLWEAATGKELRHLPLGKGTIPRGAIAFSPDSRFLAVSSITTDDDNRSDGALHFWEIATGKKVRQWTPDKVGTCSMAFSPDGKILATGSVFGPIRLWETATGKELRQCQGYRTHVVALTFSPDSSMIASLAGKHDHTARLWEVASGKERVHISRGHVGPVLSVSFSPDDKSLLSGGRDGLIGFWNAETGQEQHPPLRAGDFQAVTALSADGKTFVSIGNIFSPKGQNLGEVALKTPSLVCVWDRATGQKLHQFQGPMGAAQSLALSPDGKIMVLTSWNSVQLMEVATGKEIRRFTTRFPRPKCAAFSPDGKTLAVYHWDSTCANTVFFYATATGRDLGSIRYGAAEAHGNLVWCLAFSPDGQTFAIGGQEDGLKDGNRYTIRLFRTDTKGWKETGRLIGHQADIWGLTFSPDSKTLASASKDGTARLWEVTTGKERRRFAGQGSEAWCLAFAPDGRRLATGYNDTTILVWDVTGRLQDGQLPPVKLSARQVKGLWAELAGADAARAGQAVWTLAAAPTQALPFLQEHLRPVAPAGPRLVRLIANLDSDIFTVRQKAMDELAKLGEIAEPALRQALAKSVSLEARRRLEQLLEPLEEKFPLSGEKLRSCRALEVLGQMGAPEALQLLEALAQGSPGARRTREAQAILICLRTRVNATKP